MRRKQFPNVPRALWLLGSSAGCHSNCRTTLSLFPANGASQCGRSIYRWSLFLLRQNTATHLCCYCCRLDWKSMYKKKKENQPTKQKTTNQHLKIGPIKTLKNRVYKAAVSLSAKHAVCHDDLDAQFYNFPLGKRICKGIFSLRSTSSIANEICLTEAAANQILCFLRAACVHLLHY